ncbi:MAG: DUF4998 domain-containing protein [Tannerella sp.]|jgi:hypothetical protein|nr:DUF4998 domain-containing protein [Tannerella sp.]
MKSFIKYILVLSAVFIGTAACSDMNDLHDKYLKDGETVYIAVFDSVYVHPGENAVEIKYWLSDPKAKHVVIYWNLKNDSLKYDVSVTTVDHPGTIPVKNLDEGNISFEMYNYDANYENKSIVMQRTVSVYGDFYKSHLDNRIIKDYLYSRAEKKLTINWVSAVYENAVGTQVRYLATTGVEKDTLISVSETETVLQDVMEWSIMEYCTLYKPEETCIDIFATDFITVEIENPAPIIPAPPTNGTVKKTVTLTGTYINSIDEIWFGPFRGIIESRTETSLTATIPPDATAGTVILKVLYGTKEMILADRFEISAIINPTVPNPPLTGEAGADIVLAGADLDVVTEVRFGSLRGIIKEQTPSFLTVTVPKNAQGTVNLIIIYDDETQILVENFVITQPAILMTEYKNVNLYGPANANAGFFKLETGENINPCVFAENGSDGHYLLLADGSGGLQVASTQLNNMTSRFSCDGTALANRTHAKEIRFKKITDGAFYNAIKNNTPISLSVDGAVEAGLLLNSTGSSHPLTGLNYQQVARYYPEGDDRNNGLDGWSYGGVFFFAAWDVNTYSAPVAGIGFIELLDCSRTSDTDRAGYITVNIWYQPK